MALQSSFSNINTDNADLSALKAKGAKLLHRHGFADELSVPQGSINYYQRVASTMGGYSTVQSFYRLFLIPGMGHAAANGTSNPDANNPAFADGQMYGVLSDWVKKGIAPDSIVLRSPSALPVQKSQPVCAYPMKASYTGGDPFSASGYTCS